MDELEREELDAEWNGNFDSIEERFGDTRLTEETESPSVEVMSMPDEHERFIKNIGAKEVN